jgi:hypothetical protein
LELKTQFLEQALQPFSAQLQEAHPKSEGRALFEGETKQAPFVKS